MQAQAGLQRGVGRAAGFEVVDVHGVGDHRHLVGRDAARGDVAAQAFADGEHVRRLAQRVGFQPARQAVAQAAFAGGAVVHSGVFPEGTHFVDHRDAQRPAHAQRGDGVEHGGVRMQDVRLDGIGHLGQAPLELRINAHLVQAQGSMEPLSADGVR